MAKKSDPLSRLKKNKKNTKFDDLVAVLHDNNYSQQSITGSHYIFGKRGSLPIMIVRPHGSRQYCHPRDVNKAIKMLEALSDEKEEADN